MQDFMYKMILVGEVGAGKSSIINRLADDSFKESYISTIGVDFKFKTLSIDGKLAKLQIWDTAGQERFRNIVRSFYKDTQGVVIVFDAQEVDGLEKVQNYWMDEINKNADKDVKIMVLGNKLDMLNKDQIKKLRQQLNKFIEKHSIDIELVSAKTGQSIGIVFQKLTKKCIQFYGDSTKMPSQIKITLEDIQKKNIELNKYHKTDKNIINKCC